ncbi:MAG TPA: TGS domain-containing protein, partial [Candidatus Melainabacteria bacterium]|nr:TGS domain-containing protein [Candidatus Melainabacteria bacterium]
MSKVETPVVVTLPDGAKKELQAGETAADLAKSISEGLYRNCVGALINDQIKDLHTPLHTGDKVKLLTAKDEESLELLRHSTAHVMAEAVQSVFPEARIAIGPTIKDGFYYDFEIPGHTLSIEDLEKIEAKMKEIAKENQQIVRFDIPDVDKQLEEFRKDGEKFKAELLEEHRDHNPTLYLMKDKDGKVIWNDLCAGPHLPSTKHIKAFKLLKVSGSYWRGDENRENLQRIYATAWWSKQDLDDHLTRLEEAEKRDHRKLSKQLDLFSVHEEVGPG